MREIRTSGSMSGERKRSDGRMAPSHRASPRLYPYNGVSYGQASHDLSVHQSQLRSWVKALADDRQHAFPDQGQMKPEQLEIAQLKREVIRLKAERDILKKAAAYFAKESM